jgi:hypothetical protein
MNEASAETAAETTPHGPPASEPPNGAHAPTDADESADNGGGRLRSTIAFPYASLKDGEQIAQALQEHWGGDTSPEQLAASMSASPRSGAFRTKIATAKTFGLIEVGRGRLRLSNLGRQVVDPQTQRAARVKAFMGVPLFGAIYNEYKGGTLPPDAGLERKIADLGVSSKQTAKARQALMRSAEQAGFFKHGRDRLVEPHVAPSRQGGGGDQQHSGQGERVKPPAPAVASSDPVQALWLTLLNDGRSWSAEKTHEFVEAARRLHEVLSKS